MSVVTIRVDPWLRFLLEEEKKKRGLNTISEVVRMIIMEKMASKEPGTMLYEHFRKKRTKRKGIEDVREEEDKDIP